MYIWVALHIDQGREWLRVDVGTGAGTSEISEYQHVAVKGGEGAPLYTIPQFPTGHWFIDGCENGVPVAPSMVFVQDAHCSESFRHLPWWNHKGPMDGGKNVSNNGPISCVQVRLDETSWGFEQGRHCYHPNGFGEPAEASSPPRASRISQTISASKGHRWM